MNISFVLVILLAGTPAAVQGQSTVRSPAVAAPETASASKVGLRNRAPRYHLRGGDSFDVQFEGKNVCRLADPLFHNDKNGMG